MRIEYVEKCSDCAEPAIDILYNTTEEAFEIGRLFSKIVDSGKCVWYLSGKIRIPLTDMNKNGTIKT